MMRFFEKFLKIFYTFSIKKGLWQNPLKRGLAFLDGEGARRADRVDFHGRSYISSKQIRTELFSLFLVKLPPTEGRIAFYLAPAGEDLLHKNKPQF